MPRKRRPFPWIDIADNGVFYVRWYSASTKRTECLSLRTRNADEAQARFGAFLTQGTTVFTDRDNLSEGMTVSAALDAYWREHVSHKVIDRTRQGNAIAHLKEFFGNAPLRLVDIPLCRKYADKRRAGDIGGGKRKTTRELKQGSDATIRRELVVLQAAANHARKWRRIEPNDMPSIEMPTTPLPDRLSDNEWLTREELDAVLAAATGDLHDFIVIAYDTASRREAVETMTKFQVDLRSGLVNLRNPSEDARRRQSKKRRPVVPIGPDARPVYERLIATSPTEYLFGTPRDMYRPFRKLLTRLGLERKARPHVLRHTRATHLLQSGVMLWEVAQLLGDTTTTVERVYGHFSPTYLARTIHSRITG